MTITVTVFSDCDRCGRPLPDPDECLCPDCKIGWKAWDELTPDEQREQMEIVNELLDEIIADERAAQEPTP